MHFAIITIHIVEFFFTKLIRPRIGYSTLFTGHITNMITLIFIDIVLFRLYIFIHESKWRRLTYPVLLHPNYNMSMLQIMLTLNPVNNSIKVQKFQQIIKTKFPHNMHSYTLEISNTIEGMKIREINGFAIL